MFILGHSLRRCAISSSFVAYLSVQDIKLLNFAYVDFAVIIYFLLLMYLFPATNVQSKLSGISSFVLLKKI